MSPGRRLVASVWQVLRRPLPGVLVAAGAFGVGVLLASGPDSTAASWQLRHQLNATERQLQARSGELELVRLELNHLNAVMANSSRYRIPADLAGQIYDIALSEGTERALVADLVPAASRGRAFGWMNGLTGFAALPASVGFGLLWEYAGSKTAFLTGAAIAGIAAAILLVLRFPRPHRAG